MKRSLVILTFVLFLITITGLAFAEEMEEARGGPVQYGECGDNTCNYGENTSTYPYYCPQDCDGDSEEDTLNSCNNLYWIDNTNKTCSQKEFCGAYMYYGLHTFETQEECSDFLEEDNDETEEEQKEAVGRSCGTVTPGMQNECCQRKGYRTWDAEEWECLDKKDLEEDENECEEWNCTRWGECSSEGIRTRECVSSGLTCADDEDEDDDENETEEEEQPKLTRECYERKELRPPQRTSIDCPEECVCSGSTIKCTFENGTRIMTVYAGNSGNVIVQIKNLNMSTNVTLYKGENGKIYGNFSHNKTKEIHLPDEVKERLQNHTHRILYNESMNLTEEGYYHIQAHKKARLFWLIPVREHMRAEVDAETGEAVKIRNPWWGFLARDVREEESA